MKPLTVAVVQNADIASTLVLSTSHAAARTARATPGARQNPVTIANRIAKLEAALRRHGREMTRLDAAGASEPRYRQQLTDMITADTADLDYWRSVQTDQIASGKVTAYGPDNVSKGDQVLIGGQWRRVARANPKSVSVETAYSTGRCLWAEVRDHRPAESTSN